MSMISVSHRRLGTWMALVLAFSSAGCGRTAKEPEKAEKPEKPPVATRPVAYEPTLPYYDWGACPFECCTYRAWTTNAPVTLYKDIGSRSVVARIAKGDSVLGMTGVVITKRAGHAIVRAPFVLGDKDPVRVGPGDRLYVLHPLGEGASLMWFRGKTRPGPMEGDPAAPFEVMDRPDTEWWVKVRDGEGRVGWTKETGLFDHMDACE